MDLGSGPGQTHGLDGLSPSPVARVTRNRDDALHLQGQLDTSVCWSYTHGVGELVMCFSTFGAARRSKGVSKWIVWYCTVFLSESDFMLYCSTHRGSRVDGRLLHPITNEMESRKCAGQVALGHVFTLSVLELPRVVRRFLSRFASRCIRSDPDAPTHHDAVHGLRAAPEPDAALRETFEIPEFVALVQ